MNRNVFLLLLGSATVLAGCSPAPKYDRPDAPVSAQWPSGESYQNAVTSPDAPQAEALPWREFLADEKLRALVEIALENNRDLRLAALNVERARALYGIQRDELLPTVDATAAGVRQRLPGDLSSTGKASDRRAV